MLYLFITDFQVGSQIEANKVSTIIQEITNMACILPDTSVNGKLDNIIRQLITKYLYNESVTDCMTIISTSDFRTRIPSIDVWIQQLPGIIWTINFTKKFLRYDLFGLQFYHFTNYFLFYIGILVGSRVTSNHIHAIKMLFKRRDPILMDVLTKQIKTGKYNKLWTIDFTKISLRSFDLFFKFKKCIGISRYFTNVIHFFRWSWHCWIMVWSQ